MVPKKERARVKTPGKKKVKKHYLNSEHDGGELKKLSWAKLSDDAAVWDIRPVTEMGGKWKRAVTGCGKAREPVC